MHAVIVGHTRYPIGQPFAGGLESLTWHLARGLVARGVRVSVFAARGSQPIPGVEHLWPEKLQLSRAARADVSMPEPDWMERHHAYLQLMLSLADRGDVDIVHIHALHHLPTAMAPTLPAPAVLTLHTPPTPWLESALRVASASSGRQPTVTAVSTHTARAWAHLVDARVVPNGVDTRVWRPGPGGPGLVWSGRIVPEKAPHLAVRIAREAGMPITLAGPIADEDYAREVLWPLCADADVRYAGHLSAADLAALVGSSRAALVTPAWDEPYGLVAAEALSCGTPVLALDRGGLGEVIGPAVGRLVPVLDEVGEIAGENEIVGRAAVLLPVVLGLHRDVCRAFALEHHSVERMIDAYVEVYEEAATGGLLDPDANPEAEPGPGAVLDGVGP